MTCVRLASRSARKEAPLARITAAVCLAFLPSVLGSVPHPGLAGFSWLAGHWVGTIGQGLSEEIWTRPEGDSMMGMWRLVSGDKTKVFEFTTITVEEGGGIVLRMRHFTDRNTVARESGGPITMTLVQQAESRATFEGLEDGEKVRFTYALTASGGLAFGLEKPSGTEQYVFERAGTP